MEQRISDAELSHLILNAYEGGSEMLFAERKLCLDLRDCRAELAASKEREAGLRDAAEELLEVAYLRGDREMPHPADDPKNWTLRMDDAWSGLEAAVAPPVQAKGVTEGATHIKPFLMPSEAGSVMGTSEARLKMQSAGRTLIHTLETQPKKLHNK